MFTMMVEQHEKMLGAELPEDIVDRFLSQAIEAGHKKKRALTAAVKLWVELPPEIQAKLVKQSPGEDVFKALVEEVVQDQIQKFLASVSPDQRRQLESDVKASKRKLGQRK